MTEKSILTIINEDYYDDECDKVTCIYEKDETLNIYTVHRMMKKACLSMGYNAELVEKVFGEDIYDV